MKDTLRRNCNILFTFSLLLFAFNANAAVTAEFTISPNDTICTNRLTTFTDASTTSGGSTISGYSWDFGDGQTTTGSTVTHTYASTGSFTVTLTLTTSEGPVVRSKTVYVFTPPTANFTFPATICEFTGEVGFTNTSTGLGNDSLFLWQFGTGAYESPTFSNGDKYKTLTAGTYSVKLIAIDVLTGCRDSIVKSVTVSPASDIIFSPHTGRCEGNNITIDASGTTNQANISQWLWTLPDNSTVTGVKSVTYMFNDYTKDDVLLTVTTNAGCQYTKKVDVDVYQKPKLKVSFRPTCRDSLLIIIDSSSIVSDIEKWHWKFGDSNELMYDYSEAEKYDTLKYGYQLEGFYTITVTLTSSNNCVTTESFVVDMKPTPKVDFEFFNNCLDSTIQFVDKSTITRGGVSSWLWRFGDSLNGQPIISTQQNPTHKYSKPGKYRVELLAWSDYGCRDSAYATYGSYTDIKIYPKPVADFSYNSKCQGVPMDFYDLSKVQEFQEIGVDSIDARWWDFGDGTLPVTDANPKHTYTVGGEYIVKMVAYSAYGCPSDTTSKKIIVYPAPEVSFETQDPKRCQYDTLVFIPKATVVQYDNDVIVGYEWDLNQEYSSLKDTVKWAFDLPGEKIIKLKVTTDKGCATTFTDTITILPSPKVGFTNTSGCADLGVQFTNTTTIPAGASIVSYLWDFGDNTATSTDKDPVHTYNNAGTNPTVTLTVLADNGCQQEFKKQIPVNTVPAADFDFANDCVDKTLTFKDVTSSDINIIKREWDFGDNTAPVTGNQAIVSHKFDKAGTYTVRLIVTSAAGCKDTIEKNVITFSLPKANFSYVMDCADQPIQFRDSSVAVENGDFIKEWIWAFGDGDSSTVPNPTHNYKGKGGTYNVLLRVTTNLGCQKDTIIPVKVYNLPVPNFSPSPDRCVGSPITFNFINPAGIAGYTWTFGDGSSDTVQNPVHTYADSGTYEVKVTVVDTNGCIGSKSVTIIVHEPPVPDFTYQGNCIGFETIFTGPTGYEFYSWSAEKNGVVENLGSFPLSNREYTFQDTGLYNVTLTVQNPNATNDCEGSFTIPVRIYPLPNVDFTSGPACFEQPTEFINLSTVAVGEISGYFWEFENGKTDTVRNPLYTFSRPGSHRVKLTVYTKEGCLDTISKYVLVYPKPQASFDASPNPTTIVEPMVVFENTSKGYNQLIKWSFGDGFTSVEYKPEHRYLDTGVYEAYLVVSNANNCNDTAFMDVYINETFVIHAPTAFTPGASPDDGDGINDTWKPVGRGIQNYELIIYDRWGIELFRTDNLDTAWDGQYKGERVSEGVYVYVITIKDFTNEKIDVFRGTVTVLW